MIPIIVYRPKLLLQPLDAAGADDGAAVDVSCDLSSFALEVETPTTDVTTWCGTFQIPDDPVISLTLGVTVNTDTDARWAPLVGKRVRAEVKDRTDDTTYRTVETQVPINPSLYGPDTPGEARAFDFDLPVLSEVEWVDES